jgi:hypothetical protein
MINSFELHEKLRKNLQSIVCFCLRLEERQILQKNGMGFVAVSFADGVGSQDKIDDEDGEKHEFPIDAIHVQSVGLREFLSCRGVALRVDREMIQQLSHLPG